jgi:adenine C2-methylase RlmN of 23S rRNA A2503 and tRNA A37
MIDGINDSPGQAQQLADLLRGHLAHDYHVACPSFRYVDRIVMFYIAINDSHVFAQVSEWANYRFHVISPLPFFFQLLCGYRICL